MIVGSLFSGIGGFDLGLERAGHRVVWQVEADRQCRSVLRKHWPDVDLFEDVRDVGAANLAAVNLICGGFPCQDLSVAGRRAGLDGARSGLWREFHRIVGELLPCWVLVENVPGLRSSQGGRDLAIILRGLAELGYVGAWRSLDAQYLGLAQRRERIFLLACRDCRVGCPAEVLAIAEGLSGHPAPGRETGQVAPALAASGAGTARPGGQRPEHEYYVVGQCQGTNVGDMGALRSGNGHVTGGVPFVAMPLTAREGRRFASGADSGNIVAHTLRGKGFDASEDGTGRGVPVVADTLTAAMYLSNGATAGKNPGVRNVIPFTIPRRLTPCECERVQGFSDDWTRYADDGRELADGPRYQMLGNAVAVPVVEWIARRLMLADEREVAA